MCKRVKSGKDVDFHGVEVSDVQTLHPRAGLFQDFQPALGSLRHLRLALDYPSVEWDGKRNDRVWHWLRDFLSLTPLLQHLAL